MDADDGVLVAARPARVDHLLAAALHLGVVALYRGEIEFRARGTRRHGRGGTAAQTDEHGRAAEHDHLVTRAQLALVDVSRADRGEAACDHDRLVVAATHALVACFLLERTEVTAERGTTEFVVERGRAERTVTHDLERRGHARR